MKPILIITLIAAAWSITGPQAHAQQRSVGIRAEITLLDNGSARLKQQIAAEEKLISEYQNAMEGYSLEEALGNKPFRKDLDEMNRDNAARQRAIAVCREKIGRWQGQINDNARQSQRLEGEFTKAVRNEAKPREDNPSPEQLAIKNRRKQEEREAARREQDNAASDLADIQRRQARRAAQEAAQRQQNAAEAARLNLENMLREQQRQQAEAAARQRAQQERMRQQMEEARRQREESWRRTQQAIEESRRRMNQNRGY